MLDKNFNLEFTIKMAFDEARQRHHQVVSLEHLMLALLRHEVIKNICTKYGINVTKIKHKISKALQEQHSSEHQGEIHAAGVLQRIIHRTVLQNQPDADPDTTSIKMLIATLSERNNDTVALLIAAGINRHILLQELNNRQQHPPETFTESPLLAPNTNTSEDAESLQNYLTNLNLKASNGLIDPVINREEEIRRLIQILCRRRKNNPLLIGEAGVGKTAIVEGLALAMVKRAVPSKLLNSTIYSLDLHNLIAGTKYRGEFEQRFQHMLLALQQRPGSIVFIDEIHTIVGAGATNGSSLDFANIIKPLLVNGDLACIGATTHKEYHSIFAKDHALTRRFQQLIVKAPNVAQTITILRGIKAQFEEFYQIKYTDAALIAAAELADRYIVDRQLPDKAIDIIDEAGAQNCLSHNTKKHINVSDINQIIANIINIPARNINKSTNSKLKHLEKNLKTVIYGQNTPIEALCNKITLAWAGLNDPHKPIGSFLFVGPTGVGKTELCKQMARLLDISLLRFDMSEYMEKHSVSRLIGAPPGYLGYNDGGLLTTAVNNNRHAIVLLDEIDKAHPDILNLLLQILDYGKIRDTSGQTIDFRHTIVILTANYGSDELNKAKIGFTDQNQDPDSSQLVKKLIKPELYYRLDGVIQFKQLTQANLLKIINKLSLELHEQLAPYNIKLKLSKSAKQWLATHGYNHHAGVRPLKQLITESIKKPLAQTILAGKIKHGGTVNVKTKADKLELVY